MLSKKLISVFSTLVLVGVLMNTAVFAATNGSVVIDEDVSGSEKLDELNVVIDGQATDKDAENKNVEVVDESDENNSNVNDGSYRSQDICGFEVPEEKTYGAQIISIRRQLRVEPGETFRVKVFMKNTGSMPWFSNKSECLGPKMSLGTDRDRDRDSYFYDENLKGWEGTNRIGMDQYRTDPGQIASFTFWAQAGKNADVYKEYLTPVLKDIQWIDDAQFSFDVMIGDTGETATDVRKKLSFAGISGSVSSIDLNAPKTLTVDVSEQNLYVYLGDVEVRKFRISSGAPSTPTPISENAIFLKQWVRVGSKPPHYIMPRFMMFRAGGYGFHALPSLGGDGGVFWTEARNHIGSPVSHGCVRLLPEDADWLYDFADIGTQVIIQR